METPNPDAQSRENANAHQPGRLRFQRLIAGRAQHNQQQRANEDKWTRPRVWLYPAPEGPEIWLHLACNCTYQDSQISPLPLSLDGQARVSCAGCKRTYSVRMLVKKSGQNADTTQEEAAA